MIVFPYPHTHPHMLALSKDGAMPGRPGEVSGMFLTDAGCVYDTLADPWLEAHMQRGHGLIFCFQRPKDLRTFKRHLRAFERRGYRVAGGAQ